MKWYVWTVAVGALCITALLGCDALRFIITPTTVTVRLRNLTAASVDVSMRFSEVEDIPKALLETLGEQRERTVAALTDRDVGPFDCDEFRAVMIDDADLNVIGDVDESTDVFRNDDDFNCGDILVFTFRSPNPLDLAISFSTR